MARKKVKLPTREGTKLPPLSEEERLQRRRVGHPLDDFPVSPRMSQWREVDIQTEQNAPADSETMKRSIERSMKRSIEHIQNQKTDSVANRENKELFDEIEFINQTSIANQRRSKNKSERLIERSDERLIEHLESKQIKEAYIALDATHTASEAKVYGYLYRLSIVRGQNTCRASLSEMQQSLGLAKNTLIRAIRGLIEKLSIEALDRRAGSKIGSLFRIYPVKDILTRRKEAGIEIDEMKRIVPNSSIERSIERINERSKIEPLNVQKLNVQLNVQPPTKQLTKNNLSDALRKTKHFYLRNDDDLQSSSIGDDDFSRLLLIKDVYCGITGNDWRETDETEAKNICHIGIGHVILGICYSIDRASNHHVGSLKYCIPAILDHYDAMKSFPEEALMSIAYSHMMRIKLAQKRNAWDPHSEREEHRMG
ncbi:MAG: hypothetical protein RMM98_12650 [Acidobacteriota bacterium]|nr:hypothetical protein [Blastocatellia bacterium]MDW8240457.1 hypothetical protein [Acidobacteriota bacterium]